MATSDMRMLLAGNVLNAATGNLKRAGLTDREIATGLVAVLISGTRRSFGPEWTAEWLRGLADIVAAGDGEGLQADAFPEPQGTA